MVVIDKQLAISLNYPYKKFFIQKVLFNSDVYSLRESINCLKRYNYKFDKYSLIDGYYCFIQTFPVKNAKYITNKINNINFIYQKFLN